MIFGMPGEAVRLNAAVEVLPPDADRRAAVGARAGAGADEPRRASSVVEDSRTQAEQLLHLLRKAGYEVRVARDGVAALELAREHPPGLVLTDVVMPRMDGYTLCRTLKADPELGRTPVILLTSLSSPQDVIEGLACGADNFVRKPYEGASLLARVDARWPTCAERGRVPVLAGRHEIAAEREQVIDFLFSTFEETVHLDGELTRSYHSLDLLYRLTEGLNRATTEREVIVESLARAMELPGVRGAWIEIADGRDRAARRSTSRARPRPTSAWSCAPASTCSASCSSPARTRSCSPTRSCARSRPSATRPARRSNARCCTSTSSAACRSAPRS